ncbi:MAG: glutamate--tRNA ligase [Chloroflexi bacterium]|nr:MAG: glutamate--tRNA ligase [Chloroflexota bacterium]MBL1196489.1 glutamate--tRNA ligase [Chloroflexota bacterium]NOH13784.1 glutamate--tRNA ligase [Chloroflexota bacterium]
MTDSSQAARVRFAPSPTGLTHLGSARTALYNYLLAKQTGGKFILRIEDTDSKRYVAEAEDDLKDSLKWLGLNWDEGVEVQGPHAPYRQSERKAIYREHAQELLENGHAFYCFCTPKELEAARQEQIKRKEQTRYPGTCRNLSLEDAQQRIKAGEEHVIRFKMPREGSITVTDELRGEITFENKNLDDYILVKSDGQALYHLAAMVDDHLMEITHVTRGEEWLATFPLHVHIYRAFGWQEPKWVHLSVFLKPQGKGKMSKRDTEQMKLSGQSIFVKDLEDMGYIPEGVINWIALMGWSYDDKTEFFRLENLIELFSIKKLNPSPAAIDFKKLDHFNGLHIRALEVKDLAQRLLPFFEAEGYEVDDDKLKDIVPLLQERLVTIDDAPSLAGFFFKDEVEPNPEELVAKGLNAEESANLAQKTLSILEQATDWEHDSLQEPLRALADEMEVKAGQLFGILRVAITGQRVSPPLFESMEIIGRETSLKRIKKAIALLEAQAA